MPTFSWLLWVQLDNKQGSKTFWSYMLNNKHGLCQGYLFVHSRLSCHSQVPRLMIWTRASIHSILYITFHSFTWASFLDISNWCPLSSLPFFFYPSIYYIPNKTTPSIHNFITKITFQTWGANSRDCLKLPHVW